MSTVFSFDAQLAGIDLTYAFRFSETSLFFRSIRSRDPFRESLTGIPVRVTENEFEGWKKSGKVIDGFGEFCLACMPTSEALLPHSRCIFHAAAINSKGKAWLIAAGSGVGKSTLCRELVDGWPAEFAVINGDKPVLHACTDGTVMVYPSPWNGKEGWQGAHAAPLGGIFLLRRGSEDSSKRLDRKEAVCETYSSIFQSFGNEQIIQYAAKMTEVILNNCAVWSLTSCNVKNTARLAYTCISEEVRAFGV